MNNHGRPIKMNQKPNVVSTLCNANVIPEIGEKGKVICKILFQYVNY